MEDLDASIKAMTELLSKGEPSPRQARFKAERAVTRMAIDEAKTLEDLREVLRIMHRKLYS